MDGADALRGNRRSESTDMDRQFSRKILFFNFFYSLIMICYHANATVQFENVIVAGVWTDRILEIINQMFTGQSGTYFFMLMSAFLLYRDITPQNALQKVKRRVRTLLVPWLLWNLIGLISYHPFDRDIKSVLFDYLASRFCGQLWFVQALMLFLVFIPIFTRVFRIAVVREILLMLVFILGYLLYSGALPLRFIAALTSEQFCREVERVLVHLPVYCLGVYLGLNMADFVISETYNAKHRKLAVLGATLMIVASYLPSLQFLQHICFMLRSAALWVICSKEIFGFEPKWWMQISFYTYAIHNFILYFLGKFVRLSGIFEDQYASQTISVGFALAWRLCMTGAAFMFVVISAAILMKYIPKFYELLSGGRMPQRS